MLKTSLKTGAMAAQLGKTSGLVVGVAFGALLLPNVAAAQLFEVSVTAGGSTGTRSFDNFEGFADGTFDQVSLSDINPNYSDTTPATIRGSFRGVPLRVEYPTAGPELIFTVPGLNFTRRFDNSLSREDNEDELLTFLEDNINNILTDVLNLAVATTATDPVAGNPASLQARMVEADFSMGSGIGGGSNYGSERTASADADGDEDAPNLIGAGARLGRFTSNDIDTTVIELPFNYTIPLADPRYALIFDLPLTYVDIDGATSYAGSLGFGVRVPVFDNWSITPSLRSGITGSVDLGSVGGLYSTLGNMVSYVATTPIDTEVDGYQIEYDLENYITRNGVGLSGEVPGRTLLGLPMTWEAYVVNTQIFGDDVFIDNYTDVAFSLGSKASNNGITWDAVRLGLAYTFTNEDYSGFKLDFGYRF